MGFVMLPVSSWIVWISFFRLLNLLRILFSLLRMHLYSFRSPILIDGHLLNSRWSHVVPVFWAPTPRIKIFSVIIQFIGIGCMIFRLLMGWRLVWPWLYMNVARGFRVDHWCLKIFIMIVVYAEG